MVKLYNLFNKSCGTVIIFKSSLYPEVVFIQE